MRNNSSANFNLNTTPLNRNGSSRSIHQRSYLSPPHSPSSPRIMPNLWTHEQASPRDLGDQMRLMKSRLGNTNLTMNSLGSRVGENNLFPSQLLYLLRNQQGNVAHMNKVVEKEKARVDRDFSNFTRQITHQIEDIKLTIHSQIENIYKDFLGFYRDLKHMVSQLRQTRRSILEAHPNNDYHSGAYSPRNASNNNSVSNLNFLQEISKDEEYFKNHRLYEEITQAHTEAMGPIMQVTHNIIALGGQGDLYNDQYASGLLREMRTRFYASNAEIYSAQLDKIVITTQSILEDSNALLKDINLDQGRYSQKNIDLDRPKSNSQAQRMFKGEQSDNEHQPIHNPYGIPTFKGNMYRNEEYFSSNTRTRNQKSNTNYNYNNNNNNNHKYVRPSSTSSDYHPRNSNSSSHKYMGVGVNNNHRRTDTQSVEGRDTYNYQITKPKNTALNTNTNTNININRNIKVTRDQQTGVLEDADNIRLVSQSSAMVHHIPAHQATDVILCTLFVNNGRNIAMGSKDRTIYVYSTANGSLVAKLQGHQASVCSLANFGDFLASGGDNGCGSLIMWSPSQWKPVNRASLHTAALTCILDLLDGTHLLTAGYDKQIIVYNYRKSVVKLDVGTNKSPITSMGLCSQGRKLVTSGLDSTLVIWSILIQDGLVSDILMERSVKNCGLVSIVRPLTLASHYCLAGSRQGKLYLLDTGVGEIVKTMVVGNGTVLELVALQRKNKPQAPLVISCCNNEKSLLLTKLDTGISFPLGTESPVNISYGCGIGPKVVLDGSGVIAVASQNQLIKEVRLYSVQTIKN